MKIQILRPKSSPTRLQNTFEKYLVTVLRRGQCSVQPPKWLTNSVWGLSGPLYATSGIALKLSEVAPGPTAPHHPEGQKPQSRDCFQFSGSSREGTVCSLFANIYSCSRSISGVMKNRTKDMQCSLESWQKQGVPPEVRPTWMEAKASLAPPVVPHHHIGSLHVASWVLI